jgi:hypothetical protein
MKRSADWRMVHIEELCDVYSLCNTVRIIKLRRNELDIGCGGTGSS